ncbi:MAG: 30S ribosomal protein S2, partial [Parvibaculales bacterium]
GVPEIMFVIDTNKEAIAIAEAKTLGIPVVAILDSNCNPDNIDYPIPGNDDAARAIELYCNLVSKAVIDGIEESGVAAKTDMGAAEEPMAQMPADAPPQAETAQAETAQAEESAPETEAEVKNADEANADAPDIKDETPETEKGEDAETEKSADA